MYGLIMIKDYLDEILDGKKTFDARSYPTTKRGTIALVDSKKSSIVGLVELIGVHPISANEYCKWHATGKWAGMVFQVEDNDSVFYAYDFISPRRLARPIKITKTGKVWTIIDDAIKNEFIFQERLF
jgi:hypothetical protein